MSASSASSLSGRRIVLTRPIAQGRAFATLLEQAGAQAILYPVIEIEPADPELIRACAAKLDRYSLAFFASANAVQCALPVLCRERPWPEQLRVAAVGRTTARLLEKHGFRQVIVPDSGFDSEAVLAQPAFSHEEVAGKQVLVFRGENGRTLLGDTLTTRGAHVDYMDCYRRIRPALDPEKVLKAARENLLDAIVLTSRDGVCNFVLSVGDAPELKEIPVFVLHERIAEAAREAGFDHVIVTEPGENALLAALKCYFD